MRQSSRVMLNSAVSLVRRLLMTFLELFLLGYVLRRVTDEAYGVFLLAVGMRRLVVTLRQPVHKSTVVGVAHHLERGDDSAVNRTVVTNIGLLLGPALLVLAVAGLGGRQIVAFFDVPQHLVVTGGHVFLLAGIAVLFSFPAAPFEGVIAAHQRYGLIGATDILAQVLRVGLTVCLFEFVRPSVTFVMLAFAGSALLRAGMEAFLARRLRPGLSLHPRFFDRTALWATLGFTSFLLAGNLTIHGSLEAARWTIGKFMAVEYVTYLTVAMYCRRLIHQLAQTMTMVLVPVASRFKAQNAAGPVRQTAVRGTRYATMLAAAVAAMLLPSLGALLALWLGPDLRWVGPYGVALGLAGVLTIPGNVAVQMLDGMGLPKHTFYASLAGGMALVASMIAALGPIGAGFGGVIGAIIIGKTVSWAYQTSCVIRIMGVSVRSLAWRSYAQPALAAAPAGAVGIVVTRALAPSTWPGLLSVWALTGVAFCIALSPHLTKAEWQLAKKGLGRLVRIAPLRDRRE